MSTEDDELTLAGVEDHLKKVDARLDELLASLHSRTEKHQESKLDRPSSVQEQVQAELARAEREGAASRAAEEQKTERQQIREQLAKLSETPPAQPQPRRQRIMWGPP
jgi:peptidoglycan hydrolase CwlO-like protein